MKKVIAICLLGMLTLAPMWAKTVKCQVKLDFKSTIDSIDLAVFFYDARVPVYNNMDSLYHFALDDIRFEVPTGTYILRFMHPQADRIDVPLYIIDGQDDIVIDVTLKPMSHTAKVIETVNLIARLSNGEHTWVPMEKQADNTWIAISDSIPEDMLAYTFKINRRGNLQNPDKETVLPPKVYFYMNTNDGEVPVFDPAKYVAKKETPDLKCPAYDVVFSYSLFKNILDDWDSIYFNYPNDSLRQNKAMEFVNHNLIPLKNDSDPFFQQALIEPILDIRSRYHPLKVTLYSHYRKKEYTLAQQLQATPEYKEMMKENIALLKTVDVTSPFYTGAIYSHLRDVKYFLSESSMYPEFGLPFGFIDQMIYDLKEKSPSYMLQAEITISELRSKERKDPEAAERDYQALKRDFARHPFVKQGRADKQLRGLAMKNGVQAPDFKLVSLKGDTIQLSAMKGKYVFIDFWGSWCSPCMGELPYVQALADGISSDDLVVVGIICQDREERARKVVEEKQLTYLNAMADDRVQNDFGISSYPTTLLVDKEGRIVAKNLRGSSLTEMVEAKMGDKN